MFLYFNEENDIEVKKLYKIKCFFILFCFNFSITCLCNYHNNQIKIKDPYKTNQGYHPKIICFDDYWNGYKYWMAFTPYPYRNASKENPCINVSNDLKNWICPNGLINPIDTPSIFNQNDYYNSDTHLLYNKETNKLEIFWRYVDHLKIIIYTKSSYNGINWSQKEVFLSSNNRTKEDYISPSIIYENGKYKIWYVNQNQVWYMEKKGTFSNKRLLNINFKNNLLPWHIDVIYNKKKNIYELLIVAYETWERLHFMPLFYLYSKDNNFWSFPIKILEKSKNIHNFDSQGIYRSSLIYLNSTYFLFYSGHNEKDMVGIGLVYGRNIKYLRPYI